MTGYIIFAIDKYSTKRSPNQYQSVRELLNAQGLSFEETIGGFTHDDGTEVNETTFVVYWTNENAFKTAKTLATMFKQESILLVDSDFKAYIKRLETNEESYIGIWSQSDTKPNNYTLINNKYFTAL